ncbi:nucleotide sugar dehydrogenase [Dactylosporangium vinaceum]|uniref:Nucleotide sugar dehydrogenase n=1 Tax=Dactylosporangium vinaceum TaxID=53362 RepID=A0ABV5MS71_9ACTN|nr:nucleotide sugar dehydrogenase [Dactylosporangium vinaceum]UAC00217.1 nucleotide sugar dehydrogenase [Dactylosporangium vinaceum]
MTSDVTVCGLGYVGLALAHGASLAGLRVTGYDIDAGVVEALGAGRSHVDDVSDADLAAMAANGFTATTDPTVLAGSDVVTICVPTPLDYLGQPDLGPVRAASAAVATQLRPGMLVVLESTSYPGTTEEVVRPILEKGSGLNAGIDFHLAFSPERIDPGNSFATLANTPKVVGGATGACAAAATAFYERFIEKVVAAKGTREAEMAKLLENTYRHVNIGLVNEIAMLCHSLGIDVWNVIECASSKPFGFHPFRPGPGVGGHCIPVDPHYLAYRARELGLTTGLIERAEQINAGMPGYVVDRCEDLVRRRGRGLDGTRTLLLGVTYKANIADVRMTPAYQVAQQLRARGAEVSYHDPYIDDWRVDGLAVPRHTDLEAALADAHLVVLLQRHNAYHPDELAARARLLFDARGALAGRAGGHIAVL